MQTTVFIADLHLSDDVPALNNLFFDCLHQWCGRIDALYILGDLFDVWVGDDDGSDTARAVIAALSEFTQHTPVYLIVGNRDFLLGTRFEQKSGVQKLPENAVVTLYGKHYLLTHGDEMCTEDKRYQVFRRIMRNQLVQKILLALPFTKRQQIAAKMRRASQARKREIGLNPISDVSEQGVRNALAKFPQIDAIIHGHTHRPQIHADIVGDKTVQRFVLPDWHDAVGGCLLVSPDEERLQKLPEIAENNGEY